jgi:membrane protease YdiL (CAAX protease family)
MYVVRRKSVTAFVILSFLISYTGLFLFYLLSGAAGPFGDAVNMYLPAAFTVIGPGMAAVIISARLGGRSEVWRLLQTLRFDRQALYYLLLTPLVCMCIAALAFTLGGIPVSTLLEMLLANKWILAAHFAFQLLVIGIGEELGWRGWLLPALLKRRSLLKATMIIFPVWTIWHFPKLLAGWQVSVPFVLLCFAITVLLSWFWLKTDGNTLVVAILHAAVNTPVFFLEQQAQTYYLSQNQLLQGWQLYASGYLLAALLLILLRRRDWRRERVGGGFERKDSGQ